MNIPQYSIPDENHELFDEIAGILEFDAGMTRQDAESTALRITYAIYSEKQTMKTEQKQNGM